MLDQRPLGKFDNLGWGTPQFHHTHIVVSKDPLSGSCSLWAATELVDYAISFTRVAAGTNVAIFWMNEVFIVA